MQIVFQVFDGVEWWHMTVVLASIGLFPVFRAIAAILVGRLVKPDIAKVALPLIFRERRKPPDSPNAR